MIDVANIDCLLPFHVASVFTDATFIRPSCPRSIGDVTGFCRYLHYAKWTMSLDALHCYIVSRFLYFLIFSFFFFFFFLESRYCLGALLERTLPGRCEVAGRGQRFFVGREEGMEQRRADITAAANVSVFLPSGFA